MTKNDEKWLDDIAAVYEWPAHSDDLNEKIFQKCCKKNDMINTIGLIIFRREMFLSLLLALMLGVSAGYTAGSNLYNSETQTHIYAGSGMTLAENFMGVE